MCWVSAGDNPVLPRERLVNRVLRSVTAELSGDERTRNGGVGLVANQLAVHVDSASVAGRESPPTRTGSPFVPRRWVVEWTLAW